MRSDNKYCEIHSIMTNYVKQILQPRADADKSIRQKMVASTMLRTLSEGISFGYINCEELKTAIISITEVSVSPNLLNATVYVSILGEKQERNKQIKLLRSVAHIAKHYLSKKMKLRKAPTIRFNLDESASHFDKISRLLSDTSSQGTILQDHT